MGRKSRRAIAVSQRYLAWIVSSGALVFVAAVGYASDRIVREQIVDESRAHATRTAELLGRTSYGPVLLAGQRPPVALSRKLRAELDATTHNAVRAGAVLNAAVWTRTGRLLYADRHRLIGRTFALPRAVLDAFHGASGAKHTNAGGLPVEARVDRIDVSVPLRPRDGAPVAAVLDVDVPYSRVAADISHLTKRLDRIVIAAAALVYLALLPLLLRAGRIARRLYDPAVERMADALEDAIARNELQLEYQPLLDLRTGSVRSAEALVRWQHPTRGRIPPDEFIPVAESSPFFWDFTLHVLDLALAQCAECRRHGIELSVAVNVSSGNLLDPRLPAELRRLLAKHDLTPGALELEVTEGAIMEEADRAAVILQEVADVGIGRIAIDDFGTGHSSLARVRGLPIDVLKIDRSFIREMDATGDSALVRSVITLAHNLGLIVVAEGIENPETSRRLAQLGCDLGQGYCISRPLPAAQLVEWLRGREIEDDATPEDERRAGPGRRRDDYFSVAFKNAPEAMLIADDGRRWIDANEAACKLLRVNRDDIRRERFGAFSGGKSTREIGALWAQLIEGGTTAGEWTLRDATGSTQPIHFEATANFLPGLHLFVIRGAATEATT